MCVYGLSFHKFYTNYLVLFLSLSLSLSSSPSFSLFLSHAKLFRFKKIDDSNRNSRDLDADKLR